MTSPLSPSVSHIIEIASAIQDGKVIQVNIPMHGWMDVRQGLTGLDFGRYEYRVKEVKVSSLVQLLYRNPC